MSRTVSDVTAARCATSAPSHDADCPRPWVARHRPDECRCHCIHRVAGLPAIASSAYRITSIRRGRWGLRGRRGPATTFAPHLVSFDSLVQFRVPSR